MKDKKIYILISMYFVIHCIFSQQYNRIYSYNIEDISYFKYDRVKVFSTLKSVTEVKNETPGQLVQSVFSCSSKEWDIKNTLGGASYIREKTKREYNRIKSINKKKNYFELINKTEFRIDNIPTAILKIYFFSEEDLKPQAGIFVMQKYNGTWFKTNTSQVNNIALTILKIKPDIYDSIIRGIYDKEVLVKIKPKITSNNTVLDFNKLSIELDKLSETEDPILKELKDEHSIL